MNFKKILVLLPIALIAVCMYSTRMNQQPFGDITNQSVNQFVTDYLNELRDEEQLLWNELDRLGFSKNELERLQIDHEWEYIECREKLEQNATTTPISKKMRELIEHVAGDFNIDTNTVSIIHLKGQGYPASATDYQLLIDEDELLTFSSEAQKFIIAHELQHLLLKDDSARVFIYNKIPHGAELMSDPHYIINKINRFQEKRADTLAALKDPSYARGAISFNKELFEQRGTEGSGISHPKTSDRLTLAQEVLKNHMNISVA